MKEKETVQKKVKGIPYEVVGDQVVLHKPEGTVSLPLVLGQSAYSVAFSHLNNKGTGKRKGSGGKHIIGNFMWSLGEPDETGFVVMTVTRPNGGLLGTALLHPTQAKYPRNHALILIASTVV